MSAAETKRWVVDAGVVVKWYLHEPFSLDALRLARRENDLLVPDLIYSQVGAVLWKRVKANELRREDAQRIISNLRRLPLITFASADLAPAAMEIATATARSFNESLYFALAMRENTQLVTGDHRWYGLVMTGPMKNHVKWLEDV